MKKYLFIIAAAALALFATGCDPETVIEDSITLSTEKTVTASWEGSVVDIVFTANVAWTAEVRAQGDFLTLDKTSGEAGTVTLKLTVAKNEVDANRSGSVVITAGSASETITVNQEAVGATSEDDEKTVDFLAQTFAYEVSGTPSSATSDADWLTATISENVVNIAVTENGGTEARVGHVAIVIVKHTINLTVTQEPESGDLSNPSVSYIGNRVHVYDSNNGYYNYGQFQLAFDSEYGKVVLVVTRNLGVDEESKPVYVDGTVIPTGTFAVDGGNSFADLTFAITGDYPTFFTVGEAVNKVLDGEIVIEEADGGYAVTATLMDEAEKLHTFTYSGSLGTIVDDSFGAHYLGESSYSYFGNYTTYFASPGIYRWDITIVYSAAPSADSEYLSFITYSLYSTSATEVPTGSFTYAVPEADPNITTNGNYIAADHTFTLSGNTYGWTSDERHSFKINGTPTLSITKGEDGKYTFAVTSNLTTYAYDESWNAVDLKTFDWNTTVSVTIDKVAQGSMAFPDSDTFVLDKIGFNPNYSAMWMADAYGLGEGNNAFVLAFQYLNDNVTLYLTINAKADWFDGTFDRTKAVPTGTYTFSETPGDNTLLPTQYCYLQNTYTMTKAMINGGSFTLTENSITFDMTAMVMATGKVHNITGTVSGIGYGGGTNRSSAAWQGRIKVVPVEAATN